MAEPLRAVNPLALLIAVHPCPLVPLGAMSGHSSCGASA